jgi:hypothetical protein
MEFAYEKISIEDAKKALDGHDDRENEQRKWNARRSHSSKERLLPDTLRWMADLPHDVRPFHLGRQYPRIANEIRRLWKTTARCERYMGELLILDHGGRKRQGFPRQVALEIAALVSHKAQSCPPVKAELHAS